MTDPDQQSVARRTVLSFGGFQLHSEPAALYQQGRPVKLQGQPLRLLQLLASRRGELVTHREIRQYLWRGHVVDFAAGIQVCVTQIRKALDDDPASPRYIETVARHGYRFVAKIEPDECPSGEQAPASKPQAGDSHQTAIAGADEAGIKSDFRSPSVTGSIAGWRIWELRYSILPLLLFTIFGIVSSADHVASLERRIDARNLTGDTPISELFEKARHLSAYEQKDRNILAHNLLQRALGLNAKHGPSHALLADLYARFGHSFFGVAEIGDEELVAKHLAMAKQFGADQSDLLVTQGRVALYRDRQVSVAQRLFQRAIAANADNPWAWRLISQTLYLQGQFDEALVASEIAETLSADPNGVLWDRMLIYYLAERYAELFALYDRLKNLQQTGAITIGVAKIMVGRQEEAFDFIVNALRSRGIAIADETEALHLVRSGRPQQAYAWLLGEIAKNDSPPIGERALATFEIMSGDSEGAASRLLAYVQKFQQKATGTGNDCLCALTLSLDPFFQKYSTSRSVRAAIEGTNVVQIEAAARSGESPRPVS